MSADAEVMLAALVGLTPEQIADAVMSMPADLIQPLLGMLGQTDDERPQSPAEQAMALDEGYVLRDHLRYLSDRLTAAVKRVEAGENVRLAVSMPPRTGKSTMVSTYFVVWALARNPKWKVGLISHDPSLAIGWSRTVRGLVEANGAQLGLSIAPDAGAVSEWQTPERGGVTARSAPGQSITGRGFNVLLIDDIVRDYAAAHSEVNRKAVWEWWTANAVTRLEPPSLVIAIGCLTAESPVLLADGTERPISEVRPGDLVMTYEDGRWTTAPIVNWANVGPDHVYTLRMESGREVRGNAKHPFLVLTEEGEQWRRMDSLRPGDRIVSMPAGGPGAESSAHQTTAPHPSAQRVCASSTTTPHAGPQGTDATPPSRTDALTSDTGTASTPRTMTRSSPTKAVSARSADVSPPPRTPDAKACCSPTTITTPVECAASCATTATSSSATVPPSNAWSPPSPTSDVVQSITLDGYEDVYDIEVERTHNFVVNSLATHNTRWHEDDFIARLLSDDYEGDPKDWEVISFPAIAEENDVLGREVGAPLLSPLDKAEDEPQALARWAEMKRTVGTYNWTSQFQQAPAPAAGAIFNMGWWRYWTLDPERATADGKVRLISPTTMLGAKWIDSWDMAFKDKPTSDYVVGQRWVRHGANRYLIAQSRDRRDFPATLAEMKAFRQAEYGSLVHRRLVEDKANGTAIIATLHDEIPGLVAINPTTSKEARARAVTPEVESGNVYLPNPAEYPWVNEVLSELRSFPTGAHDDIVDTLTQALWDLREDGTGSRIGTPQAAPAITINRAAASRTSIRRGGGTGGLGR